MSDATSLLSQREKEILLPRAVVGAFRLQDLMKILWHLGIMTSVVRDLGAEDALRYSARHGKQDPNDKVSAFPHHRVGATGNTILKT